MRQTRMLTGATCFTCCSFMGINPGQPDTGGEGTHPPGAEREDFDGGLNTHNVQSFAESLDKAVGVTSGGRGRPSL